MEPPGTERGYVCGEQCSRKAAHNILGTAHILGPGTTQGGRAGTVEALKDEPHASIRLSVP